MKKIVEIFCKTFPIKTQRLLPEYFTRPVTCYIRDTNKNDKLVICEIGTSEGRNAYNMLKTLPIKKLYLIDPNIDVLQTFIKADKRVITFGLYSHDAAKYILDDSLDFCYIDGNHTYEYVKRDIELYYPKVKKGGVLGGHDFCGDCQGVCRAVMDFEVDTNLELFTKENDWWIVKKIK